MNEGTVVEERVTGKVKFFAAHRFFGFITRSEGEDEEKDIFFHGSNVLQKEDLEEGQEVVFDVIETEKGLQAVKVERVEEESNQLDLPLEKEESEEEEKVESEDS